MILMIPRRLKKLAINGDIKGYQDKQSGRGDWIFDRKSIDEYRLKPLMEINLQAKKTLDRMKRRA